MGEAVDEYLRKAAASEDGIGDDSQSAKYINDWGPTRTAEPQHAACRVFALVIPAPPGAIVSIHAKAHIDGDANGDNKSCYDLQISPDRGGWRLEAVKGYPTPQKVGCSGGWSLFESFKVLDLGNGNTVIGATFKNWDNRKMRTGQLYVWYPRVTATAKK